MTDPTPAAAPVEPAETLPVVAAAPVVSDDTLDLLAAVDSLRNAVEVMAPFAQYREESQVITVRDELANAAARVASVKARYGISDGAE